MRSAAGFQSRITLAVDEEDAVAHELERLGRLGPPLELPLDALALGDVAERPEVAEVRAVRRRDRRAVALDRASVAEAQLLPVDLAALVDLADTGDEPLGSSTRSSAASSAASSPRAITSSGICQISPKRSLIERIEASAPHHEQPVDRRLALTLEQRPLKLRLRVQPGCPEQRRGAGGELLREGHVAGSP